MAKLATTRSAADFFPAIITLLTLTEAAESCRGCDLWKNATQTVFGEGGTKSQIVLVGEQPGDKEDLSGHPFVGPAGKLLDEALEEAGIDRSLTYVTNVVKHFKWKPATTGKRRLHQKPKASEVAACKPWLEAELAILQPHVVVLLGATAAQAIMGNDFRVTEQRGKWIDSDLGEYVMATVHPSSILRAPDAEARKAQYNAFVEDLKVAAGQLTRSHSVAK
jgi:uracil-DNA glycosylase family protein